jgi:hypothetical protein
VVVEALGDGAPIRLLAMEGALGDLDARTVN